MLGVVTSNAMLEPPGGSLDLAPGLLPPDERWLVVSRSGHRRYLVPLRNPRVRWTASGIAAGYRWSARLARTVSRLWITAASGWPDRDRVSTPAGRWPLRDLLLPVLPRVCTAGVAFGDRPDGRVTLQ